MDDEFIFTIVLPIWSAVVFLAAAILFRMNMKKTGGAGRKIFYSVLLFIFLVLLGFLPPVVLFFAIPVVVVCAFVGRRWFSLLAGVSTLILGVYLFYDYAGLNIERNTAAKLVVSQLDGDLSDRFGQVEKHYREAKAQDEEAPEEEMGLFSSDLQLASMPFSRESALELPWGRYRVPQLEGFAFSHGNSPDEALSWIKFYNAKAGDVIYALFLAPAADADTADFPELKQAYFSPGYRAGEIGLVEALFARSELAVTRLEDSQPTQHAGNSVITYSPLYLIPGHRTGLSGEIGIELGALTGMMRMKNENMRFMVLAMYGSDHYAGVGTAVTWLNRFLADNSDG